MAYEDRYLGKLLDNRYEILEVIGTGGMAVVYKAICHRLNRPVAVKILKDEYSSNDEFRRRFHTESQAVAMLSHPNIVSVYDVSSSENLEYIVMELIDGITLKQYMKKRGVLTWKEALHFSLQITKALSHAHSRGIIHRDIKPHNIMILRDSSVKVADFGIARLQSVQSDISYTRDAIGSVHYISPEQAKGEVVDARTDIYSLGVVMYEMLTGRLPFEGDSPVSVAIQHISSIPLMPRELNPDIPERLEEITMKAMNPNLEERYQTIDEMMEDLEEFRKNPQEVDHMSPSIVGEINPSREKYDSGDRDRDLPKSVRERYTPSAKPTGVKGELVKEEYIKKSKNSKRASVALGVFLVLAFIVGIFIFLWHFWLEDLFSKPETMTMPGFVGTKYEDILMNPNYTDRFNFSTTYEVSNEYDEGYVISQEPAEGRTVVKSDEKIEVKLVISRGTNYVKMPNVVGKDYRQAIIELEKLKLGVEKETVVSDTVEMGIVIKTIPEAGEELLPGSTVYLTVSAGPRINYVSVPNVTGFMLNAAIDALEEKNLAAGSIYLVPSEEAIGTVLYQSIREGTEVAEYTSIDLRVSGGPNMVNASVQVGG